MLYIVSSGDGFFIQFAKVGGSPLMDTNPMMASRLKRERADEVIRKLGEMGLEGDLVEVRIWK